MFSRGKRVADRPSPVRPQSNHRPFPRHDGVLPDRHRQRKWSDQALSGRAQEDSEPPTRGLEPGGRCAQTLVVEPFYELALRADSAGTPRGGETRSHRPYSVTSWQEATISALRDLLWRRRSRMGKGLVVAGAVLLAFVLIGVFAPAEETSNGSSAGQESPAPPPEPEPPPPPAEPPPPPPPPEK